MTLLPSVLLALLLGCNTAQKQRCDEVFNAVCAHQAECGVYPSEQACKENLQNTLVCDSAASDALYENCKARAAAVECNEIFPLDCSEVLCPAGGGCGDNTLPGHCETILDPETETETILDSNPDTGTAATP